MPDPANPVNPAAPAPSLILNGLTTATAPTPTPPIPTPPADPPAPPATGDEPLGEAGKRALEAERLRAAAFERQLKAQQAELDELRKAHMTDSEKAIADARSEGEKTADARWRAQVGQFAVQAAAAGKFASPEDAHLFLDEIPFTADGKVDQASLTVKLDQLLAAKPYLAAASGATPPASANPPVVPTGPRGGAANPISKDDLKKLSPDQIAELFRKGELAHLTQPT
jgi:hypothetical protein